MQYKLTINYGKVFHLKVFIMLFFIYMHFIHYIAIEDISTL